MSPSAPTGALLTRPSCATCSSGWGEAPLGLRGTLLNAQATIRIDEGAVGEGCDLASHAADTASSTGDNAHFREASCTLARGCLCAGRLQDAQAAASAARLFRDRRALPALALLGLTEYRLGDLDTAGHTFQRVVDHAQRLPASEPDSYEVLEYEGLVRCGLALCGHPEALDDAVSAYDAARDVTSEEQVVVRCVRLLRQLLGDADPTLSDPVMRAASGPWFDVL